MPEVYDAPPTFLTSGESYAWETFLPEYLPVNGWSITSRITNCHANYFIHSTAAGDSHLSVISRELSLFYHPGEYDFITQVSRSGELTVINTARFYLLPDLATGAPSITRTHTETLLAAIEAEIDKRARTDPDRQEIANRMLMRTSINDLLRLRARYRLELYQYRRIVAIAAGQAAHGGLQFAERVQ